jgi:hypothetical protein
MAETTSFPRPDQAAGADGLYFQIVCDPGHERTTRELRQLPRESRERVWADMTGDSSSSNHDESQPEDPQLVVQGLESMNQELGNIKDNEVLNMALQTKNAHDPAFRAMFLAAENFDPALAAQRMVRHYEQKYNLFGREKLGEDIQLKDLSQEDLESLSCGAMQFLPRTDRAGRLVFVSRYRNFIYQEKENLVRIS